MKITEKQIYCDYDERRVSGMSVMKELPSSLQNMGSFSRQEFTRTMVLHYGMTEPQVAYDLKKRLDRGELVRAGWGRYSLPVKRVYTHKYSDSALDIVKTISNGYETIDFQLFELIQLNDFMNHQIAHNTIFVAIENELIDYVFESLWKVYPGKVMLKPKLEQYYRYLQDDEIVVGRLPTETPKGIGEPWMSRLEKILVDVFTDKLVSSIVPEGEKEMIIDGAFNDYLIDQDTMLRYAKRKGTEKRMEKVLSEYRKAAAQ